MEKKSQRPLILVSNDDGYNFNGIKVLAQVAKEFGEVVVVAPLRHHSGMGSAITITTPVRLVRHIEAEGITMHVIDGTPADCVKLGIDQLLDGRRPDIVLAGVNHGFNMGVSTLYSGTLGCVFEGAVHGITGIAFSYGDYDLDADPSPHIPLMQHIIARVLEKGLPRDVCLNVNFPKGEIAGIKVTTTALGCWVNEFQHRVNPFGIDYYWMQGDYQPLKPDDTATDIYWLNRHYATVTPFHVDQTDHESMSQIAQMLLQNTNDIR